MEEVLRFLVAWLAHHIFINDMRMASVLRHLESGRSLDEAKANAISDMQGTCESLMMSMLTMYEDLSSRAMELLRERGEQFQADASHDGQTKLDHAFSEVVIENIPGLLYQFDDQFQLMRWNRRLAIETGYSDEELKGKNVLDIFAERRHEAMLYTIMPLMAGKRVDIECRLLRKDGSELPYFFMVVPVDLGEKRAFLGFGIDISRFAKTENEVDKGSEAYRHALLGAVTAVSRAMEARDPYTNGHQQRTSYLAVAIAERLGLDEHRIEGLRLGAGVHDIGKLGVPVDLLVKPTRLMECEYGVVKNHVEAGAAILGEVAFPWPILDIVSQHHERLDGSGYPHGLKGDEICLEARIVAVADVYEAMSAHRPYRAALGENAALAELMRNRGKLYDPDVVDVFRQLIEEDPEGLWQRISGDTTWRFPAA